MGKSLYQRVWYGGGDVSSLYLKIASKIITAVEKKGCEVREEKKENMVGEGAEGKKSEKERHLASPAVSL